MSKVVTLKGGISAVVHFNYEKVQKRCFHFQRLNHEKDYCPLVVRQRQEESRLRREKVVASSLEKELVLPEGDILFGILEESQVGLDTATGRWKIAKEVLEEMRRYLLADTGESQTVKVDKIKKSVKMAEKDHMTQRTTLRLEAPPMITSDLNKGKGWCLITVKRWVNLKPYQFTVPPRNLCQTRSETSGDASEASFRPFDDMLNACNMEELSSKGNMFTWSGKRWKKWIQCRLDRCFGNRAWRSLFPGSNQTFLDKRGSDRRPVWVNLKANPDITRGQFRFDRRMLHHPDAKEEVENAWKRSDSSVSVALKIRKCRRVLSAWKCKRSFNAKDKINLLQERLEWFQPKPYSCWSRNHLLKLKDKNGQDQWSDAAKAKVAIDYFSEFFSSSNPPSYEPVFRSMVPKVSPSMNQVLMTALWPDSSKAGTTLSPLSWRSILFGRELLQKGLKWKVGNVQHTRVWLEKWVEDSDGGMREPWIKNTSFDDKRAWPWILWFIWKSRNKFLFQGIRRSPEEIRLKAKKEANEWFLAQEVEKETPVAEAREVARTVRRWSPPKQGWLMCNVAFDWNKLRKILGVAWVVRNDRSVVVCHSRRAFSDISCLDDARLTRILWAIESMTSMHLSKIVFAGDFRELFLAVKKPFEWPALSHHGQEIKIRLGGLKDFQLRYVTTEENRGATFIAQSVTRQGRFQSYVANGPPSWIFEFFVNESRYL
ncbi:hypothetical protein Bca52824_032766 [Brassica carinata]|uniref:RNase H type-1 domain-containing protein n=1 Tax=Brassica carinata TaxID=52824 RepID=A0A8X7SCM7_BRACI|nr:hypothetical protein Bca52824_032766 [Brassica carinata]